MKTTLLFLAISTLALMSCVNNDPPIAGRGDPMLQDSAGSSSSTSQTLVGGEVTTNDLGCERECPLQWRCDIAKAICVDAGGSFLNIGQCDECGCAYECYSRKTGDLVGTSRCGPARVVVVC